MLPLLLIPLGAYAAHHFWKRHQKNHPGGKKFRLPKFPAKNTIAHSTGEVLSPARERLHSHLITKVHDPRKLMGAAQLFKQEGLPAHGEALEVKASQMQDQAVIAADWVERARAGDQNAIGSIAATRDMANKGSARAVVSCWLLDQYIKQNPHSPTDVGPPPPAVVTSLPPDTPHQ